MTRDYVITADPARVTPAQFLDAVGPRFVRHPLHVLCAKLWDATGDREACAEINRQIRELSILDLEARPNKDGGWGVAA